MTKPFSSTPGRPGSKTGLRLVLAFVLAAALLLPRPAPALTARALVDRGEIAIDDVLQLTVVVADGDGHVDVSTVEDFDTAYRGRSSSVQIVNTQITREIRYQYALTPRRTGTLTVPALVVHDGKTEAVTDPISIRVAEAGSVTQGSSDVEVSASVSRSTAYLGQELVYTFKLARTVQLVQANYEEPYFEGFTATKIDPQRSYTEVRNGREVVVTEVSYVLVPQRVGALAIGPAVLTCQVPASGQRRRRDRFGSIFDDPFFNRTRVVEKTLRAPPLQVEVSPLPPAPGDGPFSGLVGTFSLSAAIDPSTIAVGDSATVTLVVEGGGNIREAGSPPLETPPTFKVYPDDPEEEVTQDALGTRGTKWFRYALVPTEPGSYQLGPFRLVTFDPDQGRYMTLEAGPFDLSVESGSPSEALARRTPLSEPDDGSFGFVRKKTVERIGHDILSVRQDLDALVTQEDMGLPVFVLWLAGPALFYGLARLVVAKRRRTPTPSEQMARRAEELLVRAREAARQGETNDLTGHLRRALASAILARAGEAGESLTYEEARSRMAAAAVPDDISAQVVSLLQTLDAARYGGPPPEGAARDEMLTRVSEKIRELTRAKWG